MAAYSAQGLAAADLAIRPDLTGFNRFDVRQCPALFEVGYAAARAAVPALEQALLDRRHAAVRGIEAGVAAIQLLPTTHPTFPHTFVSAGRYPSTVEAAQTSRRTGGPASQRG